MLTGFALWRIEDLIIINIDQLNFEVEIADPIVMYAPEDIVQILFTSGSTGQPKGAIEDYRYLIRAAFTKILSYEYKPANRILQLSTVYLFWTACTYFCRTLEWGYWLLL